MTSCHAEILAIGTELLLGEVIDTNSAFLAGKLRDLGFFVYRKTVIGDNRARIEECIRQSLERCNILILTGGLGPTDDDMTREAIAAVVGETPYESDELLAAIRCMFARSNRTMAEMNRKQAWLIPSAIALKNPIGTACGWLVKNNGRTIIALPGPPHEMKKMWTEQVEPIMLSSGSVIHHKTFHTHGIGESSIAELLGDMTLHENPSIATYARNFGVDVRVAASASNRERAVQLNIPFENKVREILGDSIYGYNEETLSGVIGSILVQTGQTLGIVESLTGGLIADTITETPGADDYFCGCLVPYQKIIKTDFGIAGSIIERFGVVSKEFAKAMAERARVLFKSDWGLAATGVAGPDAVGEHKPGTAFIGISSESQTIVRKTDWPGELRQVKQRTANIALMYLYKALRGYPF